MILNNLESVTHRSLSPAEWQALRVAGKKADHFRDDLPPGEYVVDATVHLRGKLKVGEDGTTTIKKRPDLEELVAYLLRELNPVRREAIVIRAVNEKKAGRQIVTDEDIGRASAWIEALSCTEEVFRNGSVRGEIEVSTE